MSGRWYISSVDDGFPALDEVDCERTLAIVQARMFGEDAPMPRFDRFVVQRRAGEGAMGRVYVAYDPTLDRTVAIKVIRIAGDQHVDRGRHQRLEREARAAARISHPNVITVHEVGINHESLFVVMEYVKGKTLREWLQEEERPLSEIVRAFAEAGRGLAAAHAHDLVHRDFKPDNVLVGDDGRICVVDFGLVQIPSDEKPETVEGPDDDDEASESVTQGAVGTPAYMSPEQRAGGRVDARSDQYSFCVALHEALYGLRPERGDPDAVRGRDPTAVPAALHAVLARGLSLQPAGRHQDMGALLSNLVDEPDRGWLERTRGAGWLLAGGVTILGGALWFQSSSSQDVEPCPDADALLTTTWNQEARGEIEAALRRTELSYAEGSTGRVTHRLDAYAESWTHHRDAACRETRVTHEQPDSVMVARLACLEDRKQQLAAAVSVLSDADSSVAENAVSVVEHLPRVSSCSDLQYLAADVKPPESEADRATLRDLEARLSTVRVQTTAGKYQSAAELADALLPEAEALDYPPILAAVLLQRGQLYGLLGDYESQRSTLQRSFYAATAADDDRTAIDAALALIYQPGRVDEGDEDLQWADTASALIDRGGAGSTTLRGDLWIARGRVYQERGDYQQALDSYTQGLERYRDDAAYLVRVATVANYVGVVHMALGNTEKSDDAFERAVSAAEDVYGKHHPRVATVLTNLAVSRRNMGAMDDAVAILDRAYSISAQAYGRAHPNVAKILTNQAAIELVRGRPDAARDKIEAVVEVTREIYGPEHRELAMALNNLGFLNSQLARHDAAAAALEEAMGIANKLPGAKDVVAAILNNQGIVHKGRGRWAQALEAYERSLTLTREMVGDDHPDVAGAHLNIGNVLLALQRHEEAKKRFRSANEGFERAPGDQRLHQVDALRGIAICQWKLGDAPGALGELAALRTLELDVMDPEAPSLSVTLTTMGEIEAESGRHEAAQKHFEEALAQLLDKEVPPRLRAEPQLGLAKSLWDTGGSRERARSLASDAEAALAAAGDPPPRELAEARAWLQTHRL